MASPQADKMVQEMANVMKERRLKIGASMNALSASSYLDPASLDAQRWSFAQTKDNGHDRNETRQIMVCHDLD
jgi:hypothetical protein